MLQIPGTGNWIISYHISECAAMIDWAVTCDVDATLPDELEGLPVRGLAEYSLSRRRTKERLADLQASAGSTSSRTKLVEIIGFHGMQHASSSDEEPEWDNLGIRSLTLPQGLSTVGSYALMGCRNLKKLTLYDRDIRWGTAPFMNCLISEVILHRETGDCGNLAFLCQEMSQELDVTIQIESPDIRPAQSPMSADLLRPSYGPRTARLLFPEFLEIWDENTPARQADYTTRGIGYAYHHVFRDHTLNYRDYDKLWQTFCGRGDVEKDALMRLAWYRVRYPEGLAVEHQQDYLQYLKKDLRALLRYLIENGTAEDLNSLTGLASLPEDILQEGCRICREKGKTQMLGVLLGKPSAGIPSGRSKKYEL